MALIAGELNINVPDLDVSAIGEFIHHTEDRHKALKHDREERAYAARNGRPYPWQRRVLEYKGTRVHDANTFPVINDVFRVFDLLPLDPVDRTVLVLYQQSQPEYDFNFHFDGDGEFGMRVCFGLSVGKPFLEFARLSDNQSAARDKRITDCMLDGSRHTLIPQRSNTAFIINGATHPHRVPVEGSEARVAFLLHGSIDHTKLEYIQCLKD